MKKELNIALVVSLAMLILCAPLSFSINGVLQDGDLRITSATTMAKSPQRNVEHLVFKAGKERKYKMIYHGIRYDGEDAEKYQDLCHIFRVEGTKEINGKTYHILKSRLSKWGMEKNDDVEEYEYGYIHEDMETQKVSFIANDRFPHVPGHFLDGVKNGDEMLLYDFNAPGMVTDYTFRGESTMRGTKATYDGFYQSEYYIMGAYCGLYKELGAIVIDWDGNPIPGVEGDIFGPLRAYYTGGQGYFPVLCSITDSDGTVIFRIPENETGGLDTVKSIDCSLKITVLETGIELRSDDALGHITLTNTQGVVVYSAAGGQQSANIPLHFGHGIYVLKVGDIVKKIVI